MLSFSKLVVTCSVLAASGIPNLSDTLKDLWSSASGSPDLSDKLRDLWSSSKESLVIEPCEKWVAQKGELSMREKRDAIPKIKSDLCTKNALSGLFSGAIPIPGVDIGTGAVAGFYLQARGACMVAALRGYDVRDNATQEMILWALAGETVSEGLKRVATVAATRGSQTLVESALKKLPSKALRQVNKKLWPVLGQHLISKGPNGLLALGKLTPIAGQAMGAVAGATVDWYFCHQAIDFAEKHVFGMIVKEEEELRNWLADESFDSNVEELLVNKHHLDIESICEISKAELEELGLSVGHALRLRKKLFDQNGPCSGAKPAEDLWALGTLPKNTKTLCTVAICCTFAQKKSCASCRDGFFQVLCENQKLCFPRFRPFSYQISIMIYGGCGSSIRF